MAPKLSDEMYPGRGNSGVARHHGEKGGLEAEGLARDHHPAIGQIAPCRRGHVLQGILVGSEGQQGERVFAEGIFGRAQPVRSL